MSRFPAVTFVAILAAAAVGAGPRARADEQIYSYEPASPDARAFAATGLSFEFERRLMGGAHIHRVIQTGEQGAAEVKAAGEGELGDGGFRTALAGARPAGGLYRIASGLDGEAFVRAICPGSDKAWLAIGPLQRFQDLRVQAMGRADGAPSAHLCVTLDFTYRNDWRLPPRTPPRVRYPTRPLPTGR